MAAIILVTVGFQDRSVVAPKVGLVRKGRWADGHHGLVFDADIGNQHPAAVAAPWVKEMADAPPTECHRPMGVDGGAKDGASAPIHPARQVDGEDTGGRCIDGRNQTREVALKGPCEPAAEKAIHNDVGACSQPFAKAEPLALVGGVCGLCGGAAGITRTVDQAGLEAARFQDTGGYERIPPVVARPRHHENCDAEGDFGSHGIGNGIACPLHQGGDRGACGNGPLVRRGHFLWRQQFNQTTLPRPSGVRMNKK